jgi:hypothetical protein
MTFQVSLSNGARSRLIAIDGVPFEFRKGGSRQKGHQSTPDRTSGLNSSKALHPNKYKNVSKITEVQQTENEK